VSYTGNELTSPKRKRGDTSPTREQGVPRSRVGLVGQGLPQPVLTWAHGSREVRVAFDRPVDPEQLRGLASRAGIEYGRYVAPGDRFEHLRPGYQVVQDQLEAPRHGLPILSVQLTPDRRTLILATAPQLRAVSYALTLPGLGRPTKSARAELPQVPETDLG